MSDYQTYIYSKMTPLLPTSETPQVKSTWGVLFIRIVIKNALVLIY